MYRSIVVPLDGSTFAEQAVPVALQIAESCGARVTLVRAWDPANYRYASELTPPFLDPGAKDRLEATQYLSDLAARLRPTTTTPLDVAVLAGPSANAINEYLTRADADLVVMSTHGLTGWSRAWIGSVADALVRIATVPVLLCRPDAPSAPGAANGFQCVLLPLDGSAEAEQILAPVAALAASVDRFVLLRIEQPMQMPVQPNARVRTLAEADRLVTDEVVRQARNYLTATAEWLRSRCPHATVDVDVRVDDHPGHAIVQAAKECQADLVALTTHARRGVRLVWGSTADNVLHGTHGSLLVLRPSALAKTATGDEAPTNRIAGLVI